MREWFFVLLCASLTGGIAAVISGGGNLERYVRFAGAAVCLLIMVIPLKNVAAVFTARTADVFDGGISAYDCSAANSAIKAAAESDVKEYVNSLVYAETGIMCTDIRIEISVTGESVTVESITAFVPDEYIPAAGKALDGIAEVVSDGNKGNGG